MTIVERVLAERDRARRTIAAGSVAIAVGTLGAALTLGAVLLGRGRWLSMPSIVPFLWWAAAAVVAVFAIRLLPRRLSARATEEAVARAAESELGLRDGSLVGLVQIAPAGGALTNRRAEQLASAIGAGALAPRHARNLMFVSVGALVATLAILSGTASSATRYGDGWRALVQPLAAARGDLLPPLDLDETPAALMRGEDLNVVVDAQGRRSVRVSWRVTGMAWRDTSLRVEDGRAWLELGPADAPVIVVATDGRTQTDSLTVGVHERPFAGDVSVRAIYPAYLDMVSEVLSPDGALRFPEGTTLEIGARTAGLGDLLLTDGRDTLKVAIEAGRARVRLVARVGGTWQWAAPSDIADLPPAFNLDVIPDLAPEVDIVSPSRDTLVAADATVRLVLAAVDDHGLDGVSVQMTRERRTGERDGQDAHRIESATGDRWLGEVNVSLAALDLNPGDAVSIVAEARDRAPWGRTGTSRRLVLRIPTADEQRDAAQDMTDSTLDHVAGAVEAQRGLERRTAEAARTGARNGQTQDSQGTSERAGGASFEAQERARELVAEQRAMGAVADTLAKEAQQLAEELRKAGVLDSTLTSQLREVERLLQEAMTTEMRDQMRQLEENRQQMSGQELQKALSDLRQPQQNALESLERAYEMLKRAALEGKLQSLSDKAADLAAQQQQFADSAGKQGATPPPAAAKDLADRAASIQKEAQELIDRLQREQADAAKTETQNAAAEAAESARRMQEALKRAMDQLGVQDSLQQQQQQRGQQQQQQQQRGQQGAQGGQGGSQGGQSSIQAASQQAASAMQDASDSFSQARQQQVDAWKRELTEALDRSIQETLQMARQQDQVAQQAQQGTGQQQLRAEQGALQQGVQQTAERVAEQGQKSALVSPNSQRAMDAARQRVEQATRELNDAASGQQASQGMREAADALRQAATAMARDRERAGQSNSASGLSEMMQQMRDLANQQGQLNGQAASMLPSQGQTAGSAEKEQVQKLADRQRELAQKIEDVADADRTGKADAMAREARQIAQQLERGALDPSVIDRQQRLFRRMLDAGRTLEQQDGREDSDRREARAGGGLVTDAPATGTARGAAAVKYREPTYEELRGYSAEERRLIIEYFRRMNGQNQ